MLFSVHLGYVDVFVPGVKDVSVVTAGQRFMTDLLVSSLMAGGGLETSLDTAFRRETQQVDDTKVSGQWSLDLAVSVYMSMMCTSQLCVTRLSRITSLCSVSHVTTSVVCLCQ